MAFFIFGQAVVNAKKIGFFETLCEDAPRNKLRGSTNLEFFELTDQKL
jgi:hypothetical protein